MVKRTLDENRVLGSSGIADQRLADHSGNIQHGYELGSLTRGLVAYYPMEESQGQVLRDAGLSDVGQINGPVWTTGIIGNSALSFDGTGDFVSTSLTESKSGQAYTLSAWFTIDNLDTGENNKDILSWVNSGDGALRLFHKDTSTSEPNGYSALVQDSNGNVTQLTPDPGLNTSTWYHAVVSISSDNHFKLYLDGSLLADDVNSVPFSGSDAGIHIGNDINDFNPWPGNIEEVRIYDRALSQPEVKALFNLTQPQGRLITEQDVPTQQKWKRNNNGAVARYEFEGDVTDSWGDNDGTDNTSAGFVDGVYGQAKDFDGSDDYVETGSIKGMAESSGTFSLWIKSDESSVSENRFAFEHRNNDSDGLLLALESTGTVAFFLNDGKADVDTTIRTDWVHYLIASDGNGNANVYKNGALVGSLSYTVTEYSANLFIGSDNDLQSIRFLDGQIDDVRIYDRALSATEVERLFNKGAYRINRGDVI